MTQVGGVTAQTSVQCSVQYPQHMLAVLQLAARTNRVLNPSQPAVLLVYRTMDPSMVDALPALEPLPRGEAMQSPVKPSKPGLTSGRVLRKVVAEEDAESSYL